MAKVKKNILLQGLSGSIGDMVFRQMPDGSTQVSAKPDYSRRKFNREQKGYQDRFTVAVAYAREAKREPVYTGLARQAGRSAYHLALADCLKAPVIHHIERRDGRVCVTASDNVMVTNVQVRILDRNGTLLEQGYASRPDPIHDPERWEYTPGVEGTIEATAWDLAGNQAQARLQPCEP